MPKRCNAPKSIKEQFASRGTGGSPPSHPGDSAGSAACDPEAQVTSEALDCSHAEALEIIRNFSLAELKSVVTFVQKKRADNLADLAFEVGPERFEIIQACKLCERNYILKMRGNARDSLIKIQSRVSPDELVGGAYDVTITKGFSRSKLEMRTDARRDLYESILGEGDDGKAYRVKLMQWLANELKKAMRGVPAAELPLAEYSFRALAAEYSSRALDARSQPRGSQPSASICGPSASSCGPSASYIGPDASVFAQARVLADQAAAANPNASVFWPKCKARNYKDILSALRLIDLPPGHTGRKAPKWVTEEGWQASERKTGFSFGHWWSAIGDFEA